MKILMFVLFVSQILFAQDFIVQKVSGNVFVQKGFEEKTQKVNTGDKLKSNDLIITDESAFIHLKDKNGNSFVLKSNSAVGVNYLRKMSLNDLILALTQEEIYGTEARMKKPFDFQNKLGQKKINGAKQLAESGFVESAILAAKETFRKYPATGKNFGDRLYFADLIKNLGLDEESISEYNKISKIAETDAQKEILSNRIEGVNLKIIRN